MDNKKNIDKQHFTELYDVTDPEIVSLQQKSMEMMYEYNLTRPTELEKRQELLKKMFADIGEGCYFEPPIHANWGCKFVHAGNNVYANFGLTLVDDTDIYIGDNVLFGPNVVLTVGAHPLNPELRKKGYQFNAPIRIGNNCWLGAGVLVMPGVTIGDNSVIGAGSVVTKDIPENVLALGTPCRVVRELGEHDREYYYKDRKIPKELFEKLK
jgi:galactoside O-acetyltransferase